MRLNAQDGTRRMTRTTAARIAGFTFLFYIAVGIGSMGGAFRGPLAQPALYAQNASAVILAITLFIVTRVEQPAMAALGLMFRLAEGTRRAAFALAGITLERATLIDATLFAIGSLFFCWLLLSGRMLPRGLAWVGVLASMLLVVCLPLQLAGLLHAPLTMLIWMPMLAFEVPGGLWLLIKGVPPPRSTRS